ncbi:DNA-directed RNA polymerase III subunit 1 isoform X4 [Magnolia sinica]|uniref:DNA-directed RNA polymerase III subunit 1 isoform X4 n=1 Tax=Magnolia sinica TaxID=86752 RepID=UPI00265AA179|nr:DNA-directed RNA polymerase III subunit 1 isoform X4 [Magnolia sinica]
MADEKPLFTKEPFIEDVGPQRIKSIRFSMLSGSEICSAAEVQVYQSGFYDPTKKPIKQGLLDSHMGPLKGGFCATCHGSFTDCPGHFGYYKLTLPVFNIGYFSTIVDILKCICKSCARILLMEKDRKKFLKKMRSPNEDVLQKNANAKKVVEKCKASRCLHCGYINGAVKKAGSILAVAHDLSKVPNGNFDECRSAISHTKEANANFHIVNVLTPVKVLALFKKMLDEDCELLHLYDRPEKLIMTDIAVPPVAIRPSVFMDAGAMSNEDDITSKLAQVIKASAKLQEDLQSAEPPSLSLGLWEHLQVEVATYINSEVRGVPLYMQPQKPLRGVLQRLKGKQGRFRGNLSGKRVEFTGRTVISPDPNLKITEVAIPILMAKVLTYPERVSYYNMEKLRQCIRNGPQKYPGANYVITPDGSKLNLAYGNRKRLSDELKYGYIVERHLEDGDLVLFNRQPSLHRMSIMSHRARIMPWRTLRFNESVCNPYNADFDGDEMNLHVPQTEEARTEALMLMGVQNNLCTPKNGEILVASTQDFLTSSFLITRKDTFYDRAAFSLMCSYMGDGMDPIDLPTPVLIKPIELWTGKQLFSVLIRPHARMRVYLNLTLTEKNYDKGKDKKTMCPNDGYVYFRNSELLCGQLGKATLGNGNKDGLFSVLLRDYGAHAAASCMNRLAKLSARWIGNHGFSIGIDDVQPGEHLNRNKKVEIDKGYKECDDLINRFNTGGLKLLPGCNAAQTLESNITGKLNNIREAAAKVCMASLHWRNSPLIMSQCGSKGSPINISQMVACVGQQSVGGRRAPNGFIDRSLPHFPINSKTPAAKGFVANSFYTGLTATEFFFHTMGGREGLVDTAVKTAETGYMSRRLMKSLEDLSTYYDETVRNSSGGIVQLLYGDDGMDPAAMEGKEGMPLNLDRLFMKTKATFPATRAHTSLSPSEIFKAADDRLSKHDVTPEGGCSAAFKESLSDFLKKSVVALRKTRRELGLDEDKVGEHVLENVAANISGITSQQLQVAKSLKVSYLPRREFVSVKLDKAKIEDLQMKISAYTVAQSILQHPKIKLKQQHIEILSPQKLKLFPPEADKYTLRFKLDSLKKMLLDVIVEGIPTVERAVINHDKEKNKFNLLIEGTNLRAVMGTPGVDGRKTKSNHIIEIEQTLGIEAARKCIIDEIKYTMQTHGMSIDIRHMMLLADVMTFKGQVLGITNAGIAKMKDSVLMLASFEKTGEHLFNASIRGRIDQIEGVSECIIMGIPMQIGTGILKVKQRDDPVQVYNRRPDLIMG